MKKLLFGFVFTLAVATQASAGCHLKDNKYVICDGKQIGEVWCGMTGCEGYCEKRVSGKVKKYGDRDKAAQSVMRECKR